MASEHGGEAGGFPAELKRQREGAGLSQVRLAERVGCDHPTVSRYECGTRRPSLPMAVKLAAALSGDEGERCKLVLAAGFVPPSYEVTGLRRQRRSG